MTLNSHCTLVGNRCKICRNLYLAYLTLPFHDITLQVTNIWVSIYSLFYLQNRFSSFAEHRNQVLQPYDHKCYVHNYDDNNFRKIFAYFLPMKGVCVCMCMGMHVDLCIFYMAYIETIYEHYFQRIEGGCRELWSFWDYLSRGKMSCTMLHALDTDLVFPQKQITTCSAIFRFESKQFLLIKV